MTKYMAVLLITLHSLVGDFTENARYTYAKVDMS